MPAADLSTSAPPPWRPGPAHPAPVPLHPALAGPAALLQRRAALLPARLLRAALFPLGRLLPVSAGLAGGHQLADRLRAH